MHCGKMTGVLNSDCTENWSSSRENSHLSLISNWNSYSCMSQTTDYSDKLMFYVDGRNIKYNQGK